MNLTNAIVAAARSNVPLLVWSDPGLGKTALAESAASVLTYTLPDGSVHPYRFISFSAAVLDPVYLGGVPMASPDGGSLQFMLAGDFASLTDPSAPPTLLLVDELNRCSGPVMNLLLRLMQERMVGQYRLNPGVRIVATANPADSGARPISAALANRVIHLRLSPSDLIDGWHQWMRGQSPAHQLISAFLERRPELAHAFPKSAAQQEGAWPSFRSWDNVGRLLSSMTPTRRLPDGSPAALSVSDFRPFLSSPDGDAAALLCEGLVGGGPVVELFQWLRSADIPHPADTLSGKAGFSSDLSVLTAQIISVVSMLRHPRGFNATLWAGVGPFLARLSGPTGPETRAAMSAMFVTGLFAPRDDGKKNIPDGWVPPVEVARSMAFATRPA